VLRTLNSFAVNEDRCRINFKMHRVMPVYPALSLFPPAYFKVHQTATPSSLDGVSRQRLVITQSKALRYQIRLRSIPARTSSSLSGENSLESGTESGKAGEVSMKVNTSSPNHIFLLSSQLLRLTRGISYKYVISFIILVVTKQFCRYFFVIFLFLRVTNLVKFVVI